MFAESHQLIDMNAWFSRPPQKVYPCKFPMDKPGKMIRNEIDYITANKRYKNCCTILSTLTHEKIYNYTMTRYKIKLKLKECQLKNNKYTT